MKLLRRSLHLIYEMAGHVICRVFLCWWSIRDWVSPPKSKAILIIAHPDDDTLFFHSYIKENKPYVVLMTTGWSLKRLTAFIRVMHCYGVRFRAYDTRTNRMNRSEFEKRVEKLLRMGKFSACVTHSQTGEYGNSTHVFIHTVVNKVCKLPILVPATAEEIENHPISAADYEEKCRMFENYYTTECFVVEQYDHWMKHEWLTAGNER